MRTLASYRRIQPLLCLIIVLAALVAASPAAAATEPVKGVDIVFLIDQSTSMQESDPLGLRFASPQYAIDGLGRMVLEYGPEHPLSFRVAVVDFGSYPQTVLAPLEVAPKSEDNWQDISLFTAGLLAKEKRQDLGTTEIVPAFKQVAGIFAGWGAPQPNRQRVIVLLTDGLPYPDSDNAMTQLEEYYRQTFPSPAYQLYVIGLSSAASPWPLWEARWNALSQDHASRVDNKRLLGVNFHETISSIGGALGVTPDPTAACGIVPVAPYLNHVRFAVHNPVPELPVKVFDAQNRQVNDVTKDGVTHVAGQTVEVRGVASPIQSLTVYDPEPGNWRIECPSTGEAQPVIFLRQVSAHYQFVGPGQRLALGIPYGITFRLLDHSGKPLPPAKDPRFALDVRVTATAVGQANVPPVEPTLRYVSERKAYEAMFTATKAGDWTLDLLARTATPDGADRTVVKSSIGGVRVSAPQTVVKLPQAEIGQLSPVTFTVALVDDRGNAFTHTTENLTALKADATIVTPSETITVPLASTDIGLYTGVFTPYAAGRHEASARVNLLDPTQPKSPVVGQGESTAFNVQPLALVSTHLPQKLTQLVPVTLQLVTKEKPDGRLAALGNPALWSAVVSGLGKGNPEVQRSTGADGAVALTFTPLETGAFKQPQAVLTLKRPGGSVVAGTLSPALDPLAVAAPQAVADTPAPGSEQPRSCTLAIKLLDAEGRPFAKTIDSKYTLAVTAHEAGKTDAPKVSLQLGDDGLFRAASGLRGVDYLVDVLAVRNGVAVPVLTGLAAGQPNCPASVLGFITDSSRPWLLPVAIVLVLLVITLVGLGIAWWLKRLKPSPKVEDVNEDACGCIVLERPRGTPLAEWDLGDLQKGEQTWTPGIILQDGEELDCPVAKVVISQSVKERDGEGPTEKCGAHVKVYYENDYLVFSRWVDEGIRHELKNQWYITFRPLPGAVAQAASSASGLGNKGAERQPVSVPSQRPVIAPTSGPEAPADAGQSGLTVGQGADAAAGEPPAARPDIEPSPYPPSRRSARPRPDSERNR